MKNTTWQYKNTLGGWTDAHPYDYEFYIKFNTYSNSLKQQNVETRIKPTSGDFSFDEDPPVDNYPKY